MAVGPRHRRLTPTVDPIDTPATVGVHMNLAHETTMAMPGRPRGSEGPA